MSLVCAETDDGLIQKMLLDRIGKDFFGGIRLANFLPALVYNLNLVHILLFLFFLFRLRWSGLRLRRLGWLILWLLWL